MSANWGLVNGLGIRLLRLEIFYGATATGCQARIPCRFIFVSSLSKSAMRPDNCFYIVLVLTLMSIIFL